MKRLVVGALIFGLLAAACGDGEADTLPLLQDSAAGTCLAGDPDCADDGTAGEAPELPSAVALGDPDDPGEPLAITFGGFFYSDGTVIQLCSALAESSPPMCGTVVIDIEAPIEVALEHVRESFGNPEDAKIEFAGEDIYWTNDWVNLSGTLQANRLVLE